MKKYKIYSYPEGWEDVLDSEKDAELIDEVCRSFQKAYRQANFIKFRFNTEYGKAKEAQKLRHKLKRKRAKVFLRRKNNES